MSQIAQLFHQMRAPVSMNNVQKSRRYPTSISSFHVFVSIYPWTLSHTCAPTNTQTCISMHTQHAHFPRWKKPKIIPWENAFVMGFSLSRVSSCFSPVVCLSLLPSCPIYALSIIPFYLPDEGRYLRYDLDLVLFSSLYFSWLCLSLSVNILNFRF